MSKVRKFTANAYSEWDDYEPLRWFMRDGSDDRSPSDSVAFDLTRLAKCYETGFLLELKDILISKRNKLSISSIYSEMTLIRSILQKVYEICVPDGAVSVIDHAFLAVVRANIDCFKIPCLWALKRTYIQNRDSKIFSSDLIVSDFPIKRSILGLQGEKTSRILSSALTRAACVEVLRAVEDAYESKKIGIEHFSFCHLAFNVFCRPNSYRQITISDLCVDVNERGEKNYFLYVMPSKTRIHRPEKIAYRLNTYVGELLGLQRAQVVERYSHLVDDDDVHRLALFPARRLTASGKWMHAYARENYGMLAPAVFSSSYMEKLNSLVQGVDMNFNRLRHTIGTQLAVAGCSAKTIQSVLKHATDSTCQAYVDLAFGGLIDKLSDGLKPGFDKHFPVFDELRSKQWPIAQEKAIASESDVRGGWELTGECGGKISCEYAPLACYECSRFIPCYDADHGVNLRAVEKEISRFEQMGGAFRHLVEKNMHIRRHIQFVISASNRVLASKSVGESDESPC